MIVSGVLRIIPAPPRCHTATVPGSTVVRSTRPGRFLGAVSSGIVLTFFFPARGGAVELDRTVTQLVELLREHIGYPGDSSPRVGTVAHGGRVATRPAANDGRAIGLQRSEHITQGVRARGPDDHAAGSRDDWRPSRGGRGPVTV